MSDHPRTWLAGESSGVVLACNGDCPGAGDLVVAEYGETATVRKDVHVRRFALGDFDEFLAFASAHAYNCTPPEELDADQPHWGPLRALIPADQLDGWMWMARSTRNGVIVEQYKHRETRGYLNLDHAGNYWQSSITEHGCDPWCGHENDADHREDVFDHVTVTEHQAFERAGVWPWSLHDEAHPAPKWMLR